MTKWEIAGGKTHVASVCPAHRGSSVRASGNWEARRKCSVFIMIWRGSDSRAPHAEGTAAIADRLNSSPVAARTRAAHAKRTHVTRVTRSFC